MLINGKKLIKNYLINKYMYTPKQIELNDEKLKKLIEKKGELITEGRAKSERIEEIEKEMQEIDNKLVEAEKEVDISDIDANAKDITERFNTLKAEMDEVNRKVRERLSEHAPLELREQYHTLKKELDQLESDRNKIAIKAQKYNDKIIPTVRALLKPHILDDFEDYGAVKIEDDKIIGEIINHLEEYKINFLNKKYKN